MRFPAKALAAAATVAAAALGAGLLTPGVASADPPPYGQYAGVGSDTTQYLMDQIAIDIANGLGSPTIESWDATGSSPVCTHDNPNDCIQRPDGSAEGIDALLLSIGYSDPITAAYIAAHGNVPLGSVDWARSSAAPTDTSVTELQWVPLAGDAVTWSFKSGSPLASASLTAADLNAIYSCTKTSVTLLGGGTAPVTPVLPQSGSSTRKFFLQVIGNPTLGSCVVSNPSFEENTGAPLVNNTDIYPYSIADYIAQVDTKVVPDVHGSAVLGGIAIAEGGTPVAPTTGSGAGTTINPDFPGAFQRLVYTVIPQSEDTSHTGAYTAFAGSSSEVCSDTTAIEEYGFRPLGANCGDTAASITLPPYNNGSPIPLRGVH